MKTLLQHRQYRVHRFAWVCVLFILVLAACRALPRINPDMAAVTNARVQVDSAGGPLSPQRSQTILADLKSRAKETNLFERHLALEEALAGSPLVAGNKVALLQDGPATYPAMLAAIRDARDHINMETYIFDDDETGQHFAEALIAKRRQGVAVNLVYDAVGAIDTPREFFKKMSDAGIRVLEFNPVNPLSAKAGWNLNERNHRKLLIIDGRVAFLGGINISAVYSSRVLKSAPRVGPRLPWRDTQVQIEGPVVAEYQKMFLDAWASQKADPLAQRRFFPTPVPRGKELVRAMAGSPDEPVSAIYATFISAIRNAETEVLLTIAYFAPDPQMREALKGAVRRGVDVRLILPSQSDVSLIFHAGRSYYHELLEAGVRIHERRNALLHAKTAVIDGVWSTVGTTNLDWRSALHNHEVNAVVLGPEFAAQMKTAFQRDLAASDAVTLERWQRRPFMLRVKESLARIWEYWL